MQLLKINTNIMGEPKTTILQVCTSFLQVWTCILYLCLGLRAWLRFGIPTENWKREWRVGSPETRRPASTLLAQAPTCGPLSQFTVRKPKSSSYAAGFENSWKGKSSLLRRFVFTVRKL